MIRGEVVPLLSGPEGFALGVVFVLVVGATLHLVWRLRVPRRSELIDNHRHSL